MDITNILDLAMNFLSMLGLLWLGWDKVRGRRLRATLNGKSFSVPADSLKDEYRRMALAEASRLAGGRRVNLEMEWDPKDPYHLLVKSDDPSLAGGDSDPDKKN